MSGDSRSVEMIHVAPGPQELEEGNTLHFTNAAVEDSGGVVVEVEFANSSPRPRDDPGEGAGLGEEVEPNSPEAVIDLLLEEVLTSRPSVVRGQSLRRPRTAQGHLHHPTHNQTMPHHQSTAEGFGPRSSSTSSLPDTQRQFVLRAGDLSERDARAVLHLRVSTRRLRDRITEHHNRSVRKASLAARESLWANFRHVKWPKLRSRLRVLVSYELWKGHMKEVEGHFGSAVVSYFIFLRSLFFMNIIIFALWFGFVVVPGIVQVRVQNPPHPFSRISCVHNASMPLDCPGRTSFLFYECVPGDSEPDAFQVRECVARPNSSEVEGESSRAPLTVSNRSCSGSELILCEGGVNPFYPWYQFIFDFALGQGVFNDTILFYGRYSNTMVVGDNYDLPLAYFIVAILVYAFSVLLLVYKMGQAYNESYVNFSSKRRANFSNKVFTAWDFNITHPHTAKLRHAQIKTDFEEELVDIDRRLTRRSKCELAKVVLIRFLTNSLTVIVLILAGATIFYAAQFSLEPSDSGSIQLEGLVLPVVITAFNAILPFLFSFLARYERFLTHSGEVRMTLIRAIFVRLSSLVVLITTLFILIRCTQTTGDAVEDDSTACTFNFDPTTFVLDSINETSSRAQGDTECTTCWETFFGQEFYKLGLINFIVAATGTILIESAQNIVSRVRWKGIGARIGRGTFNIPKSILDLIYTQSILWLGFIFCPLLPIIILITTIMLFYVKKFSLVFNLTADQRATHRAARTNFIFLFLMFLALFGILIPIAAVVASLHPSPGCGPFRSKTLMYSVLVAEVDTFSCAAQAFFDYLSSPGFVVPIIVILLLVVYTQYVLLKARKSRFHLIKQQLFLEGSNVAHIVGRLKGAMKKMVAQRQLHTAPMQRHDPLQERRNKHRAPSLTAEEARLSDSAF